MTHTTNAAGRCKPLVIGLTGGIGSGKSTVAALFSALGVPVLDADQVTRDLVVPGAPALEAIIHQFGPACLQADGTLDRAWLRDRIFSDPESKQRLEAILHPSVRQRMQGWIAGVHAPYCILVIPLLLESGQTDLVDRILVVDVPETEQRKRVAARDHLSHNAISRIMACQTDRQDRLAAANDIIDNDTDPVTLQRRVADLHRQFLELMHEH